MPVFRISDHALERARERLSRPDIDRDWIKARILPDEAARILAGEEHVALRLLGLIARCDGCVPIVNFEVWEDEIEPHGFVINPEFLDDEDHIAIKGDWLRTEPAVAARLNEGLRSSTPQRCGPAGGRGMTAPSSILSRRTSREQAALIDLALDLCAEPDDEPACVRIVGGRATRWDARTSAMPIVEVSILVRAAFGVLGLLLDRGEIVDPALLRSALHERGALVATVIGPRGIPAAHVFGMRPASQSGHRMLEIIARAAGRLARISAAERKEEREAA